MKMKKINRSHIIIFLICCALFSLGLSFAAFSQRLAAAADVNYQIEFHGANAAASNYVYYDIDQNSAHVAANEPYIYNNNRFNPSKSNDVALVWTAPADGTVSAVQDGCNIILNRGGTRTATSPDGLRYNVITLKTDYTQIFSNDYHASWNFLEYKPGEQTQADYAQLIDNIQLKQGESIAIAVNCGANSENTYDEAVISASLAFTPAGGEQTVYTFDSSWITVQCNAIKENSPYELFGETTAYFGWGTLMAAEDFSDVLNPSEEENEFLQVEDYAGVYFYEADGVIMGSQAPSYVYYDADGNKRHYTAAEPFVYADNRFNPSQTSDVALWWTAPADGNISIDENSLMLVLNEKLRTSTSPDGIRYAVIIAGEDGSFFPITVNLWNNLSYTPQARTRAALKSVSDIAVTQGDRLAVIVNCGEAGNNSYDEAAIYAKISFTPTGGEATAYTFNSAYVRAQGEKINAEEEYPLNSEETSYFSWGKAYLNRIRDMFATEGAYSFGAVEETPMEWNGQRWYGNSICVAYPDSVNENTGKFPWIRLQPDFGKNVAVTFTATEDCVAAITRLHLAKSGARNQKDPDGVRWAIVYKQIDDNGEAKYYSINDPVWTVHEFDGYMGNTIIKTHTDFPDVQLKSGEQLMVVFDNNKVTGYDTIAVQIDLQYTVSGGELKTCNLLDEVVPNETYTYEHWSFKYLRMGQDYSDTVIGEAENTTFESIGEIETEELSYDLAAGKWLSYSYPDISVYSQDNLYYLTPDENRAVAVALKIGKEGRIAFDDDTYIRLDTAGSSNGIRFRILKNDEIIYPAQNGWKYVRNDKKLSVQGLPVMEIGENDTIYFVIDSFGDTSSDLTECNFVVHFTAGTDVYRESYIFSDSYAAQARNGWSYHSISFPEERYTGVIQAVSGSGCSSSVETDIFVIVPLLATAATVIIFRRRSKLK